MTEDKALAYFNTKLGKFALTPPIRDKYPKPKHFLVRMSPESIKEHKDELVWANIDCVKTRSGSYFCLLTCDEPKVEMELMEMYL